MWGSNSKGRQLAVDTLVGRNTCVAGDVHFAGGLHVDGRIKGNVRGDAEQPAQLSLSEHGCIEGEVRVADIEIDGSVVGDVYAAGRLELGTHARIDGNVYYNVLQMAGGAAVNGKLLHRPADDCAPARAETGASALLDESFEPG